ncbi:MAG TPA: HAD-IIA family hydrolase [Mycobacteriales bacterium]|nr:HAD-IIA family hydrolase [Mycobacteriales bacterium]
MLYDLDGVLYLGAEGIPHAPAAVEAAAAAGLRPVYVTNNASRRPTTVAAHLTELGIPAAAADVVTSAQATVRILADAIPAGAAVLVVGSDDLAGEIASGGFVAVRRADGGVAAVAQGLSPEVGWPILAEAALAIGAGAFWVAANVDTTYPTPRGSVPGCGAFVAALEVATGHHPVVAGKPGTALYDEVLRRLPAQRPLVVGDRLDTDIAMALAARADSLLVLTGVVDEAALLRAPRGARPTYVGEDLRALAAPQGPVELGADRAECAGARAWREGEGWGRDQGNDGLRAACALAWATADALAGAVTDALS